MALMGLVVTNSADAVELMNRLSALWNAHVSVALNQRGEVNAEALLPGRWVSGV